MNPQQEDVTIQNKSCHGTHLLNDFMNFSRRHNLFVEMSALSMVFHFFALLDRI